ncbi:MAG: hypothetical protein V4724_21930 [Pseudomonadota bacterium]
MSTPVTKLPANAECRCLLDDGRELTITASRRARANRAEVKCAVAGAPALSERMQEVVRLARHTEHRFDSRDQVVLSMDIAPPAGERGWELAAVLADRIVRGAWQPAQAQVRAHGWSDAWHLGGVTGRAGVATVDCKDPQGVEIADSFNLSHLGALTGHTDPSACVSSARAWFPLHSGGINDSLSWVEVSVHPLEQGGADEEDTIAAPGLGVAVQLAIRQALAGARHFDGRGLGRWRTVVRFGQPKFQGSSYQLALVMADRLARGREFVPRGRIIATGCSSAWHAGRVETVEGCAAKTELILKQAAPGDRVLLPMDWQDDIAPGFALSLRAKGATLACIDRIGVI